MKNLKKVLALVLVVAMMMGFATVAGAADFTDAADVSHDEAVDVMTAIGVINGYPDGSFRPEGNVTRAQMAKMIAYIVSGGEDVGSLYAGATAFSDCLTHWARGYIAYANTQGIIAGVGNGRFNPDGNVTGAQAAKMMLCALGYDQDSEGYTGTGWSVNVLSDARTLGLLDGLNGVNMNAALSREDASQLMFNALQANMVEYARGNIVVDGGNGTTVTVGGSEASFIGNSASKDYRVTGGDSIMQMCEYYFDGLELNAGSPDDFGRPSNKWEYKNDAIGTYAKEADATYTAEVKSKDIYSDLGLSRTTTATVTEDGADNGTFSIGKNDSTNKIGGNGVLVEAYMDDDKNVDLVVINTYVGEISAVYEDADDPYSVITPTTGSPANNTFETTAFDEDDVVLYTVADGEIQSVALAEKVSDLELTSTTGNTKFVADGTTYTYNKTANQYGGNLKDSIDVYLDNYGYVVYVEKYEAGSGNYAFVLDYKKLDDDWEVDPDATSYEVKLLLTDGTVVTVKTDDQNPTDIDGESTNVVNAFVSYTVDDDDETYTLYAKDNTSGKGDDIDLNKGTSKFDINGASSGGEYYANDNTIFLVYDTTNKEYTAYTGIGNVPSMDGSATVYVNYKTNSKVAQIVYIAGADTVVSIANKGLVYIIEGSESGLVKDSDRGEYYTYDAVIDGEITTIDVAKSEQLTSGDVLASNLTYNSKDVVTDITLYGNEAKDPDDYAISGMGTKKTTDGTVGLTKSGTTTYYTYADDVAVFRIEDNDFKAASITSIRDDADDTWAAVVKDGEVVAIFITTKGTNTPGSEDPVDTNVTNISLNATTGRLAVAVDNAPEKDTTYSVAVAQLRDSGFVDIGSFDVTVKAGANRGDVSISDSLVKGQTYRITYGDIVKTVAYSGN